MGGGGGRGGWWWGGGGILPPGIGIPNLLTNYPMKLHEIKTMCTNLSNFR